MSQEALYLSWQWQWTENTIGKAENPSEFSILFNIGTSSAFLQAKVYSSMRCVL